MQVCRSWREKVSTNEPLWKELCWQKGGYTKGGNGRPDDYYFQLFMRLQRALRLMMRGTAFTTEEPAFMNAVMANRRELACSQIAYSNGIIAIGK